MEGIDQNKNITKGGNNIMNTWGILFTHLIIPALIVLTFIITYKTEKQK